MRIHLHLGLHKTGTTSLQQVLLDAFGAADPRPTWYPAPRANGPGHAELAWRAAGYNNRAEDDRVLAKLAQTAVQGGCRDLILSRWNSGARCLESWTGWRSLENSPACCRS